MRTIPHLTRTRPPTTITCIAALGIARSGGLPWLLFRIGIAVLAAAVLDGVDLYLDPPVVAR